MQIYALLFIAVFAFCVADECPGEIKIVWETIEEQFCRNGFKSRAQRVGLLHHTGVPEDRLDDYLTCSSVDGFDLEKSFLACSRESSDLASIVNIKTLYDYVCQNRQKLEVADLTCCTLSVELKGTKKSIKDKADIIKDCSEKMQSKPK